LTTTALETGLDAIFAADDSPITADEFRVAALAAVRAGVELAGDAFAFSVHSDGFTYGVCRWRFVLAELGLAFASIPGADMLVSGGMKVSVLPIGDDRTVLIYPLCFADDSHTSPQYRKVRPSRLRKLLFAGFGTSRRGLQMVLPGMGGHEESVAIDGNDVDAAEEDAAADDLEAAIADLPQMPRTVIVGYASNPSGGLLQLVTGEATMESEGTLTFSWLETLSLPAATASRPYAVSEPAIDRFDDDPEPTYDVVVREDDAPEETPHA
jgi:hypothetical protein